MLQSKSLSPKGRGQTNNIAKICVCHERCFFYQFMFGLKLLSGPDVLRYLQTTEPCDHTEGRIDLNQPDPSKQGQTNNQ